jgi:hypothetical protein
MSRASSGRSLALLTGAALAAFLLLRGGVTALACHLAPADAGAAWLPIWALDTALTALVLLGSVAGCGWLTARARRRDREQARVEHLAEVGLLAGGLAHEVRNTLNAMHSQIALLRKQLPPGAGADAARRADQIERAVAELE